MKNLSILNLLAFTCFLVIGYTFSIRFYQDGNPARVNSGTTVTAERLTTLPTMKNGQYNLLLISTNAITSWNPQLESIWLASFFDTGSNIQLLPIFPAQNHSASDFEGQLNRYFNLVDEKGSLILDPGFVNVLKNHNYWWSGYIIIDEVAQAKLAKLSGNTRAQVNPIIQAQAGHLLPEGTSNTQQAYTSQLSLLQSVCHDMLGVTPGVDFSQLISQLSKHILTDLGISQLRLGLDNLSSPNLRLTCRFPTLEMVRSKP